MTQLCPGLCTKMWAPPGCLCPQAHVDRRRTQMTDTHRCPQVRACAPKWTDKLVRDTHSLTETRCFPGLGLVVEPCPRPPRFPLTHSVTLGGSHGPMGTPSSHWVPSPPHCALSSCLLSLLLALCPLSQPPGPSFCFSPSSQISDPRSPPPEPLLMLSPAFLSLGSVCCPQ